MLENKTQATYWALLSRDPQYVMNIKVSYFASLREEIGHGENTINSDEASLSISTLWTLATQQKTFPNNILIAVNQEYVDLNSTVVDGDEVSFFPPVTGG